MFVAGRAMDAVPVDNAVLPSANCTTKGLVAGRTASLAKDASVSRRRILCDPVSAHAVIWEMGRQGGWTVESKGSLQVFCLILTINLELLV